MPAKHAQGVAADTATGVTHVEIVSAHVGKRLRQGETIEVFGIKRLQHGFLLTRDE
jgi:hypothetical protein